jgi:hypothetical protein
MTASQDLDAEATMTLPKPVSPSRTFPEYGITQDIEPFDPDKTLVREDWESTAIRRVARHVAAVQSSIAEDAASESRFGWESEGLRRLALELQRAGK